MYVDNFILGMGGGERDNFVYGGGEGFKVYFK